MVGFGGSESSKRALKAAFTLAKQSDGEVLALTAERAPEPAELEVGETLREADGPLGKAIGRCKQETKRAGVDCTFRTQIGHAAELLTRIADADRHDLTRTATACRPWGVAAAARSSTG
ncbi:MAG: universal stress protein [Phycisphaerae bacterium]